MQDNARTRRDAARGYLSSDRAIPNTQQSQHTRADPDPTKRAAHGGWGDAREATECRQFEPSLDVTEKNTEKNTVTKTGQFTDTSGPARRYPTMSAYHEEPFEVLVARRLEAWDEVDRKIAGMDETTRRAAIEKAKRQVAIDEESSHLVAMEEAGRRYDMQQSSRIQPHVALDQAAHKNGPSPTLRNSPGMTQNSEAKILPLTFANLEAANKRGDLGNNRYVCKAPGSANTSDDGEVLISDTYAMKIEEWADEAERFETTLLTSSEERYEESAIDTVTGVPMAPVKYPNCLPGKSKKPNNLFSLPLLTKNYEAQDKSQHQSCQTSATSSAEYCARLANPKPEDNGYSLAKHFESRLVTVTPPPQREPNPYDVQVSCHLRPAVESDMEAVAAIYNREVVNSYTVMDMAPIQGQDFVKIYHKCKSEHMPFAVAVEGLYDADSMIRPHVIGFVVVIAVEHGLAGSFNTQSCPGGKIMVIVKPEYRRKKLGTALLDLIFSNCSGMASVRGGYQFVNACKDERLVGYVGNPRKWYYMDMQVMILSLGDKDKTKLGDEYKWILDWLELKFSLLLIHYEDAFYNKRGTNMWLDRLTFRHRCRGRGVGSVPLLN